MHLGKEGLTYINHYHGISGELAVEKVFIDKIPRDLVSKLTEAWKPFEEELKNPPNLERLGSKISNIYNRIIPFKGFISACEFFKENDAFNQVEFSNRYLLRSVKDKPRKLSTLVENYDLNCVGQSVILQAVAGPAWEVYNEAYKTRQGELMRDSHCVIATKIGNHYLTIDPSNGPLKERRKRIVYSHTIPTFSKKYKKAIFIE